MRSLPCTDRSVIAAPGATQTAGASTLGVKSFFSVPVLQGEIAIGTVCGASLEKTELDAKQLECMQLIADALKEQLEFEREKILAQTRIATAERDAADARVAAKRHAEKSVHMEQLANTYPAESRRPHLS